jgi:hypothetical protein
MERAGWTIGFAAADRELAERVAKQINHFERRVGQLEAQILGFGPAEIEAQSAGIAADLARWCALPEREAEFESEIARLLPQLRAFRSELKRVIAVRALEIWRVEEVRERLQAGGELPGLTWNDAERRAKQQAHFHAVLNPPDYVITAKTNIPPAMMLPLINTANVRAGAHELMKAFDSWVDVLQHVQRELDAIMVRTGLSAVAGNVIFRECSNDSSTRWIAEGLGRWAWRETAFTRVPPKEVERYALFAAQLPVGRAGQPWLRLDQWPEAQHDDAAMMARQVFCNIEERHGSEAIPRLMAEFWQLPQQERTTAALKTIYRRLMNEPLEGRAPWRSLGEPNAAETLVQHRP